MLPLHLLDIGRCGVSANETILHPNNNLKKVNHYMSMYDLQHGALAHTKIMYESKNCIDQYAHLLQICIGKVFQNSI